LSEIVCQVVAPAADLLRPVALAQLTALSDWAMRYYAEDQIEFDRAKFAGALRGAISKQRGSAWWIQAKEDTVGYAIVLDGWSVEFGGLTVELDEIYVAPEFRGQRHASAAILALRAWSQSRGAVFMAMETTPNNVAAQQLYQRLGFVNSGRPVFRSHF
jgi:ribosomal protein S18 acetylase RimI-like enzyme